MLAAVPAGRAIFPGHGFEVGAVQRGCRPKAVEHDADGAAIAAHADDDPFPAGEIWAPRRSECAHPDAGPWRQPKPLFGRLWGRSRRTKSHCGTHLFGRRGGSRGSEHAKVRLWRQFADKHGNISADAGGLFDGNAFVANEVHIERYSSEGWAGSILQLLQEKWRFLATFLLEFPCFRRLLVTPALLGIPFEQE